MNVFFEKGVGKLQGKWRVWELKVRWSIEKFNMKVLCFGSLNIDKATQSIQEERANQAVALARAAPSDLAIHHAGQVGTDGKMAHRLVEPEQYQHIRCLVSQNRKHGLRFDPKGLSGDNAIILLPAANCKIPLQHIDETLSKFDAGDWLLVQNEINNINDIIRKAKARGMQVAFNPAPCPPIILSYSLECVDVLVLNEGEAEMLYSAITQKKAAPEEGASALQRGSEITNIPALRDCRVVDTTGAGDTFVGFFLATFASLQQKKEGGAFKNALKVAAIASGMTCETHGATPSIPLMKDVQKRMLQQ
ncbi:Ribokinase-like protein [Rhizoclosmatium globosum]|uniref:Ribokinase-like protein n=1 Tax=Rhizoclosmatium globosum TaxID=329046 RepID=A0A1Y2CH36_9FUNG|nr:Ribokinase-like protein [Rhizoclosmatium globosum]|eukprot:ORY46360.1 Ribokinase-like protein [Rhizoclosmatium globosum]